MSETLLSPADAARLAGVSTETLRRYIRRGLLPATRLPGPRGRLRIDRRDLVLLLTPRRGAA